VKSPSFNEFQTIIQFLHDELEGSQLQEVYSTEDGLVFGFYRFVKQPKTVWLVIDLDQMFPFLGMYDVNPWPKTKKTKPLALFLNSHFKNTHLKRINVMENYGRVAVFDFSLPQRELKLELILIPKQPNLIAFADRKNVSWEKPRDLIEINVENQKDYVDLENRSVPFMMRQWLERRSKVHIVKSSDVRSEQKSPYDKWVLLRSKDLAKKQKALAQIQQQNIEHQKAPWSEIGEFLKIYGFKNLPIEWTPYVQFDLKVSQNIQICFEKAKSIIHKIEGSQTRLLQLQKEISELQDHSEEKYRLYLDKLSQRQQTGVRKHHETQFRKLILEQDDSLTVLMGKSAQENVKLLRQAKSWDLWIHLKDYPSAYAILHKNKDKNVNEASLIQASQWLIRETFKNKKNFEGIKISVVITECRFVRPIKGDKIGRVTYHNPRELLISL